MLLIKQHNPFQFAQQNEFMLLHIYCSGTQWEMAQMPFHVQGHAGCNNRRELPLSLLVNGELQDKSKPDFMAHVGDVRMSISEGRVFLFALAPFVSAAVDAQNKNKKFTNGAFSRRLRQNTSRRTIYYFFISVCATIVNMNGFLNKKQHQVCQARMTPPV